MLGKTARRRSTNLCNVVGPGQGCSAQATQAKKQKAERRTEVCGGRERARAESEASEASEQCGRSVTQNSIEAQYKSDVPLAHAFPSFFFFFFLLLYNEQLHIFYYIYILASLPPIDLLLPSPSYSLSTQYSSLHSLTLSLSLLLILYSFCTLSALPLFLPTPFRSPSPSPSPPFLPPSLLYTLSSTMGATQSHSRSANGSTHTLNYKGRRSFSKDSLTQQYSSSGSALHLQPPYMASHPQTIKTRQNSHSSACSPPASFHSLSSSSLQRAFGRRRSSNQTVESVNSSIGSNTLCSGQSNSRSLPDAHSSGSPPEDQEFRWLHGRRYHNSSSLYMLPNDAEEVDR